MKILNKLIQENNKKTVNKRHNKSNRRLKESNRTNRRLKESNNLFDVNTLNVYYDDSNIVDDNFVKSDYIC